MCSDCFVNINFTMVLISRWWAARRLAQSCEKLGSQQD